MKYNRGRLRYTTVFFLLVANESCLLKLYYADHQNITVYLSKSFYISSFYHFTVLKRNSNISNHSIHLAIRNPFLLCGIVLRQEKNNVNIHDESLHEIPKSDASDQVGIISVDTQKVLY